MAMDNDGRFPYYERSRESSRELTTKGRVAPKGGSSSGQPMLDSAIIRPWIQQVKVSMHMCI